MLATYVVDIENRQEKDDDTAGSSDAVTRAGILVELIAVVRLAALLAGGAGAEAVHHEDSDGYYGGRHK